MWPPVRPNLVVAEVTVLPLTVYLNRGTLCDLVVLMLSMLGFRVLFYAKVAHAVATSDVCVYVDRCSILAFVGMFTVLNLGWLAALLSTRGGTGRPRWTDSISASLPFLPFLPLLVQQEKRELSFLQNILVTHRDTHPGILPPPTNIFFLSSNPQKCARYHVNRHVVKILESAQLLSTCWHVIDPKHETYSPRSQTHPRQPSVRQVGARARQTTVAVHPCPLPVRRVHAPVRKLSTRPN